MAHVFFSQCDCGVEFKIMNDADGRKQILTCDCHREIHVVGTVLDLYSARENSGETTEYDWIRIPLGRVKDLAV